MNACVSASYQPSEEILEKYAKVMIRFALNSGKGLHSGEIVELIVPDIAKSLALMMHNEVLKAGGHPLVRLLPTGFERDYYHLANDDQLTFFARDYWRAKANLLDHHVQILADPFPHELQQIDSSRIIKARDARREYRDWLTQKELENQFTWSIALWGDQAKADLVGLSLADYWQQIIQACFLDEDDPVACWQEVATIQEEIKTKLNHLPIERVHLESDSADLWLKIGQNRQWCGGGGRNIPSFEIFTSPDWRGSEGWIEFNQPVYRYGNEILGVRFELKDGLMISSQAKKGQELLEAMLKSQNANKLGEFSLTDKRLSRITHPMAEILYDENIGGEYGNTHIAIGSAYKECYKGVRDNLSLAQWADLGFNDSAEHTDFISTANREVTGVLTDGSSKVIYRDGMFVL